MASPTVEEFCKQHGGKPLFKTQEEYEKFCTDFGKRIAPELEKNRIARIKSIEYSMTRFI